MVKDGVHVASRDGTVLHSSNRIGDTDRIGVLILEEWILGTTGDVRRLATEGSAEGALSDDYVSVTLPYKRREPKRKNSVRHKATGDVLARYVQ